MLERLHQDRGRDRIVDNERNAMAVRDFGNGLDIADVSGGIADGLAKHRTGRAVDQPLDIGGLVACRKPDRDPLPRQHVGEQRVRRAVKLGYGDEVAAGLRHVQHGVIEGRLAARDA
jgi:hypothetical protein